MDHGVHSGQFLSFSSAKEGSHGCKELHITIPKQHTGTRLSWDMVKEEGWPREALLGMRRLWLRATAPEVAQSHYRSNSHPGKPRVAVYCFPSSLQCAEQAFGLIGYV